MTEKTIRNCFHHAGIIREEVSTEIECSIAITEEDEDDLPLSEWVPRIDSVNHAILMDLLVLMMTLLQLKL